MTDSTLGKVLSSCAELRHLDISCCVVLTDSITSKLAKAGKCVRVYVYMIVVVVSNHIAVFTFELVRVCFC